MERYKRILITIIALIGLFTSLELTKIFYESNYNPYALNSFCSVNNFIDCDGVARTAHAVFFGVPLAIWGLVLYTFILFLTYADKLKNLTLFRFMEVFKNPASYVFAVGIVAFFISITLMCISLFEIKKLCILCFFTYLLNLLIAIVAAFRTKRLDDLFVDCFRDFMDAVKIKKYFIAFMVVVVAFAGLMAYTSESFVLAPHMKKLSQFEKLRRIKTNPYKVKGNILGDADGKVVVYLYTDFQCPACSMFNIIVHKAAHELKNVRFVHKNFPLDSECNKMMTFQIHEGSCMLAKYNIAAGNQDKYWEMNNLLFDKKPKTAQEVLKYAKEAGFDTEKLKKDAESKEVAKQLEEEISLALNNKLNATPVLQVGMKMLPGLTPYEKLEEILINAGAEKR